VAAERSEEKWLYRPGGDADRHRRIASAVVDTRTRAPYGARAGKELYAKA